MNDTSFHERIALITGGSGLIGSAIARELAARGTWVLVHYGSDEAGALRVVDAIRSAGGHAEAARADLSTASGTAALIAQLDTAFAGRFAGALDVLVNNAGVFDAGMLVDATDESFDTLFNVNVRALFQLSREAARRMIPKNWGRIVNIGSVFGEAVPSAGLSIYSASKFAVRGLTRAWSRDLGPHGITVNNVQPALIQSDPPPTHGPAVAAMERFTSVGRFGRAEDVARAVAFLVDENASYITGESLTLDGGWNA